MEHEHDAKAVSGSASTRKPTNLAPPTLYIYTDVIWTRHIQYVCSLPWMVCKNDTLHARLLEKYGGQKWKDKWPVIAHPLQNIYCFIYLCCTACMDGIVDIEHTSKITEKRNKIIFLIFCLKCFDLGSRENMNINRINESKPMDRVAPDLVFCSAGGVGVYCYLQK